MQVRCGTLELTLARKGKVTDRKQVGQPRLIFDQMERIISWSIGFILVKNITSELPMGLGPQSITYFPNQQTILW
eukprot:scaffold35665_cov214-Amphora_coffeaeformis.AAC.1